MHSDYPYDPGLHLKFASPPSKKPVWLCQENRPRWDFRTAEFRNSVKPLIQPWFCLKTANLNPTNGQNNLNFVNWTNRLFWIAEFKYAMRPSTRPRLVPQIWISLFERGQFDSTKKTEPGTGIGVFWVANFEKSIRLVIQFRIWSWIQPSSSFFEGTNYLPRKTRMKCQNKAFQGHSFQKSD